MLTTFLRHEITVVNIFCPVLVDLISLFELLGKNEQTNVCHYLIAVVCKIIIITSEGR